MSDLNKVTDAQPAEPTESMAQNKQAEASDIAQAQELAQQGNWRDALPLIENILHREPRNGAAMRLLSRAASALGEVDTEARILDELAPQAGENATFLAFHAQA